MARLGRGHPSRAVIVRSRPEDAGIFAPAAVATASVSAPTVGLVVMAPAAVATASVTAPVVGTIVAAPAAIATAGVVAPGIVLSPVISPPSAAAVASAPTPSVGIFQVPRPAFVISRSELPLWLAAEAIDGDGRTIRWGFEEVEDKNIPTGIGFGTVLPGGFGDGQLTLHRDLRRGHTDLGLLRDFRLYGPGNQTAYEGRLKEIPGEGGGADPTLQVLTEGHSAHLKDDESFREIYVDIDLSRWRGMSMQRRLALLQNSSDPYDGQLIWDQVSGIPGIGMSHEGAKRNVSPHGESWYEAPSGVTIKKLYADYRPLPTAGSNSNYIPSDANFNAKYGNATDDQFVAAWEGSSDLAGSGGTAGYLTLTTNRRFAWLQFSWNLTTWGHTLGYVFSIRWAKVAVYGNHGLTLRGATFPQGIYGSDVIADVLTRVAPQLTYTTGTDGSIAPSTFVIPQCAFVEPTTAEQVILAITAQGGATNRPNDWGVYENKEFFWRAPETYGRSWRVWVGETTTLRDEGPQIEDAINGVIVQWNDAAGNPHVVGPTGSGFEATDATLADTDTENPANIAGIRRWPKLSIGTTTYNIAVQVGQLFLAEALEREFRGEINHVGPVMDDKGVLHPPWMVRAGDVVSPMNLPNPGPFRIVSTSYNHDSRSVSMALDSPPARLDVMINRLQAVLTGAGV